MALSLGPKDASAQSATEIAETSARLAREIPCIREQQERLRNTLRLLEEAQQQVTMSSEGSAAQRDAVHAAAALELRLGVIVGELRACLGQANSPNAPAATAETTPSDSEPTGRTVVTRRADATANPEVHPAERPNPATEVIARNETLAPNIRLALAERVDGTGRADPATVRDAVNRIAPRISTCYEQLSQRGALQRGRVYLTFSVTPSARVRDIRLENFTIYDRGFQRCVGAAAGRLHVQEPAVGGSARYSFHIVFGPPEP